MILGILLGFVVDDQILKDKRKSNHVHDYSGLSAGKKIFQSLVHAVDEFFDTGRYLIFGSFCLAAGMQTYLPTRILTTIGHNSVTAILIMMLLRFILFTCVLRRMPLSELHLLSSFGVAPTVAFLIIGPMVDIKNLMMMKHQFKTALCRALCGNHKSGNSHLLSSIGGDLMLGFS